MFLQEIVVSYADSGPTRTATDSISWFVARLSERHLKCFLQQLQNVVKASLREGGEPRKWWKEPT